MDSHRHDGGVRVGSAIRALLVHIFTHQHAASQAQRTIEPAVVDHAAVGLDVETQRFARAVQLRRRFNLERGRVGVRRGDLEVIRGAVEFVREAKVRLLRARGRRRDALAHLPGDDA